MALRNLDRISPLSSEVIEFLATLARRGDVDRILVFGSRAFGDYEKYSDLDLAIDAVRISKYDWLKLKEIAIYDLRTVLRISLVNYSTNPKPLRDRIDATGMIIYERKP